MNFIQAITTCFKKCITFKGRASRPEFWYFQLFLLALYLMAHIFAFTFIMEPMMGSMSMMGNMSMMGIPTIENLPFGTGLPFVSLSNIPFGGLPFVAITVVLFLMITGLSVTVRRLHDTGRTGWWALLFLLMGLGYVILLTLCSLPSDSYNKYDID